MDLNEMMQRAIYPVGCLALIRLQNLEAWHWLQGINQSDYFIDDLAHLKESPGLCLVAIKTIPVSNSALVFGLFAQCNRDSQKLVTDLLICIPKQGHEACAQGFLRNLVGEFLKEGM
jgi:hypothetical protein